MSDLRQQCIGMPLYRYRLHVIPSLWTAADARVPPSADQGHGTSNCKEATSTRYNRIARVSTKRRQKQGRYVQARAKGVSQVVEQGPRATPGTQRNVILTPNMTLHTYHSPKAIIAWEALRRGVTGCWCCSSHIIPAVNPDLGFSSSTRYFLRTLAFHLSDHCCSTHRHVMPIPMIA